MHQPYYTHEDRTQKRYTVRQAVEFAQVYLNADGWDCRKLPSLPPASTAITLQRLNELQEQIVLANRGNRF